jgi:hypothetical protein
MHIMQGGVEMKKLKYAVVWLLLLILVLSASGCMMVNPQYKFRVKGTYRLTTHNYTQGKENPTVIDYLQDKGEVAYLILDDNKGWYIYKDNETPVTKKPVSVRYEYSPDEPKKVAYVYYKIEGEETEMQLGVTRKALNGYKGSSLIISESQSKTQYNWKRECFLTNFWWVNIKMGTKYR